MTMTMLDQMKALRDETAQLADLVDLYVSERRAADEHAKNAHMAMAGILSQLTDAPADVDKILHVIARARG